VEQQAKNLKRSGSCGVGGNSFAQAEPIDRLRVRRTTTGSGGERECAHKKKKMKKSKKREKREREKE
jgi:hypothetical protein